MDHCSQPWQAETEFIHVQFKLKKRRFWASTLSPKMCFRKQTPEPKVVILVSLFLGEITSYRYNSYCINLLWEACRFVFFSVPPCIVERLSCDIPKVR